MAFEAVVPNAGSECIILLTQLLAWNPNKRPTTAIALRSPYFSKQQSSRQTPYQPSGISHSRNHMSSLQKYQSIPAANSNYRMKEQPTADNVVNERGLRGSSTCTDLNKLALQDRQEGRQQQRSSSLETDDSGVDGNGANHTHAPNSRASVNSKSRTTPGLSAKDQYLSRARYVAGQSVKSNNARSAGKNLSFCFVYLVLICNLMY